MDQLFAEWYSEASIQPTDELLKKRWAGVQVAAEKLGQSGDLVRLYLGRQVKDPETLQQFRQAFFDADATFLMHDNTAELRVLAGAVLAHRFAQPDRDATELALALICNYSEGLVRDIIVAEVVRRAKELVLNQAIDYRNAVTVKVDLAGNIFNTALQSAKQSSESGDAKAVGSALHGGLEQVTSLLKLTLALSAAHNSLSEEVNILWWLFGEVSTRLEKPYSECSAANAVLHMAKEMYSLTTSRVGPAFADALLGRMVSLTTDVDKPLPLAAVLDANTPTQRKALISGTSQSEFLDFCPIHLAIAQAEELQSVENALTNVSARLCLNATMTLKPRQWALQFYRECLLLQPGR